MINLDAIERLARDATPGPWAVFHTGQMNMILPAMRDGMIADLIERAEDARFIAALFPDVVLALIEMARKATSSNTGRGETASAFDRSWQIAEDILAYFDSYKLGSVAPIAAVIEKAIIEARRASPAEVAERAAIDSELRGVK